MQENVPSLEELVKRAGDLQMMPQTARKVVELVSKETTTADSLAAVIEKDANITTRILKISNSAFYGLRREVTTIQHAIVILGYKSVRSLVIASSTKAMHKRFGITEQLMWDQSVGAAIFGRLLARNFPTAVGELAFVGGLLHNVGKAIMNNECPKTYVEVMKLIYNDNVEPLEAESKYFQYTYPEVGYRVIEKWGLPENIVKSIRYHRLSTVPKEEKEKLFVDPDLKLGLACIEMATEMCRYLGIGFKSKNENIVLANLESAKLLSLQEEQFPKLLEDCQKAFESEKSIFN